MPPEKTIPLESVSWLQRRLQLAARRHRFIETATFVVALLSISILVFSIYFLADFLVHFPSAVRILLTAGLVGTGVCLATRVAHRWIVPYRTLNDTARAVQRADELAGRKSHSITISALEFGERPAIPGSVILKNQVIKSAKVQPNDPARAHLHSRAHLLIARHAATAALVVAGLLVLAGPRTTIFLLRMAGLSRSYPSATCIALVNWQRVAPARVDYPVSVTVTGRVPSTAMMTVIPEKSRSFSLPMTIESNGVFSAILQGPEESFSFSCTLGDATAGPLPVTIRKPPLVTNMLVSITPPPYTTLPARQEDTPTVTVPESSILIFTLSIDSSVESCTLTGEGRLLSCAPTPKGTWTARLSPTNTWNYSVSMTTRDKLTLTDPTTRKIIVTPDSPPSIELRSPKPNSVVAPNSLLVFDFSAQDDYAVKDIGVNYQVFERRNDTDVSIKQGKFALPASSANGREASGRLVKPVADFSLATGHRIVFTAYAVDNKQPNALTGTSDQAPVTVVTPEELRRMLDAGLKQSGELIKKISDDERLQSELLRQRLTDKSQP